tara:strand:- start:1327 stop:1530 length:204 start_codon:yes stop_codon:yes gene_type:complete
MGNTIANTNNDSNSDSDSDIYDFDNEQYPDPFDWDYDIKQKIRQWEEINGILIHLTNVDVARLIQNY